MVMSALSINWAWGELYIKTDYMYELHVRRDNMNMAVLMK